MSEKQVAFLHGKVIGFQSSGNKYVGVQKNVYALDGNQELTLYAVEGRDELLPRCPRIDVWAIEYNSSPFGTGQTG